jgi:epoxyqueuosine reductase QueG
MGGGKKMTITQEIKRVIKDRFSMNLVGIAPASAFKDEDHPIGPCELLPGAKSVIVFGRRLISGSVNTVFRKYEDGVKSAFASYQAYGSDLAPNMLLIYHTFELSRYLERTYGAVAMPLPCGSAGIQNCIPEDTELPRVAGGHKIDLPFDISRAAVLAGLGQIGLNGFVLTPQFGPRIQFGAVITTMELDCDKPFDSKICEPEKCGICVEKCPMNAIPSPESGKTEINSNRCMVASCGLIAKFGRRDVIRTDDPTDEELKAALRKVGKDFPDHLRKNNCDLCMAYCPVGNRGNAVSSCNEESEAI